MVGDGGLLATTLLVLLAMCGAVIALAVAMRRWGMPWLRGVSERLHGPAAEPARLVVLQRVALAPRRSLVLVEVDGQTLLLGVGDASVALLADVSLPAARVEGDAHG